MTISSFFGEYRFLSNAWPSPFLYQRRRFASVNEAYQWCGCATEAGRHAVLFSQSPGSAKMIARQHPRRPDWSDVRMSIMTELLALKFEVPELRKNLLATGNHVLIDGNSWNDTFWGMCHGVGENHLGRLLMELRTSIRAKVSA